MVEKGTSTFGADQDDIAFMPYTTFVRRITGDDHVAMVMISTVSDERTDEAKEQIEALMRQRRHILPGEDDDFNVRDMRELQSLMGTVTGVLTTLLLHFSAPAVHSLASAARRRLAAQAWFPSRRASDTPAPAASSNSPPVAPARSS